MSLQDNTFARERNFRKALGQLPLGRFAQVRIIGYTDYDLIGEPA
jgi:hypothetical protein